MKEKIWHVLWRQYLPWSACLLTGFIWSTGNLRVGRDIPLTSLSPSHKARGASKQEERHLPSAIAINCSSPAPRKLKHSACLKEQRGCCFLQDLYSGLKTSKQVTARSWRYLCRLQECEHWGSTQLMELGVSNWDSVWRPARPLEW